MEDKRYEKMRHRAAKEYGKNFTDKAWDPKPKDDKTWWMKSHCGPGSLDGTELCECCLSQEECARENTEWIKKHHEQQCGCSGFWCPACGVFYAQDACWETYGNEYETVNGVSLTEDADGMLLCGECGIMLFKEPEAE